MRIKYIHKIEYKYEDPVQLGEHRLYIIYALLIEQSLRIYIQVCECI